MVDGAAAMRRLFFVSLPIMKTRCSKWVMLT